MTIEKIITRNTGVKANEFLKKHPEPYIHNLKEGCDLLLCNKSKKVIIIGDYDVDGIFGSTIMELGLRKAGFDVSTRIPLRFSEGYGLSEKIIDELDNDIDVIVTVDNGIAAYAAIEKAKAEGKVVIITDHHLAPVDEEGNTIYPPADIIIDPTIDPESEYHDYCGAAVAYRFIKELLGRDNMMLKVLASIATVADVMPLTVINHQLVKEGLRLINANRCVPALKELLKEIELSGHITEDDYGFLIGPIINASSRLYDNGAAKVLNIMLSGDSNFKLPWQVKYLIENNEKRKEITKECINQILPTIGEERPIVVFNPNMGEGIIGLVAGNLCERFKCPVIAFTRIDNGLLKGSGRSISEIHLKNVLDKINDKIVGYGGHAGAAGLTIKEDMLKEFTVAFMEACGEIPKPQKIKHDIEVIPGCIEEIVEKLNQYAPYGNGNPKVKCLLKSCIVEDYRVIGNEKSFMCKFSNYNIKALGFDLRETYEKITKGLANKKVDCIGYLSESWYKGKMEYKLEIVDIRAS